MGDFSSWLTLSMKFDCRWLSRMPLIEISRYKTTPTSTSTRKMVPISISTQNRADCSTSWTVSRIQPTISVTTNTIITTASVIGHP